MEYVGLVALLSIVTVVPVYNMMSAVSDGLAESVQKIEETNLVQTGYVSKFAGSKVMGIARNYPGKVTFIQESAGFHNALGMYRFNDGGAITDIRILFSNASAAGSGGNLIPGESSVDVDLRLVIRLAFFCGVECAWQERLEISGDRGITFFSTKNGRELRFTLRVPLHCIGLIRSPAIRFPSEPSSRMICSIRTPIPMRDMPPNSDGWPHTVGFVHKTDGIVTLGFEDLKNGGDMDYDDIVFEFDVGRSNAAVLDPNLDYDYAGYDSWVARLKLSETKRIEVPVMLGN